MEMATRHKGLSELVLRIHFQTYLLLQDLLLPHANTSASNSRNGSKGGGEDNSLSMERASERRAILEQANKISKFVTVDLRALLSYQRSKGFEGAFALAAAVPKFTFQTTDYAHRASDARARDEAILGDAAVQHYRNEDDAAQRHEGAREAAHKAAEQYTLELKRARLRFFATLTRGAGVLKLLCAAPPRAAKASVESAERGLSGASSSAAAADYTRVPGSAAQLGRWRLNCCPALTTSSSGGGENAEPSSATKGGASGTGTKEKAGFWGSSTLEPGQWTSDDVSKDRLIFKLGAVDLCTRLVNLGSQGRCPTLVVQALQSLRNLALVTPPPLHVLQARAKLQQGSTSSSPQKALKRLPDNGNLRKAALLGGSGSAGNSSYHEGEAATASVTCVQSSVHVGKKRQDQQQEVVVSVLPLQVRVAVAAQGDLMHNLSFLLEAHKKRAPKVVEAGLSLLVALSTTTSNGSHFSSASRNRAINNPAAMIFGGGSASEVAAKHCAQLMNEAYIAAPRLALAAIDLYTGGAIAVEQRAAFEPQRRDLVEFPDKRSSLSTQHKLQAETSGESAIWLFQALGGTTITPGSSSGASSGKGNNIPTNTTADASNASAPDPQKQREVSVGPPEPGSSRMWAENGENDSEADKKAAALGAVAQALALLRNLAAPVGPSWAVEARRATLVDLKVHERTTAALLAFPHEAQVCVYERKANFLNRECNYDEIVIWLLVAQSVVFSSNYCFLIFLARSKPTGVRF